MSTPEPNRPMLTAPGTELRARVVHLITREGMTYNAAIAQARRELRPAPHFCWRGNECEVPNCAGYPV